VLKIKSKGTTIKTWKVPKILLSGNHQKIAEWRGRRAREKTLRVRPDLI
jgi:tRNA (guanine37-N1)-methyltransferase